MKLLKIISEMKMKPGGKIELEPNSTHSWWYDLYILNLPKISAKKKHGKNNLEDGTNDFLFFIYTDKHLDALRNLLKNRNIPYEEEFIKDRTPLEDGTNDDHYVIKINKRFILIKEPVRNEI